MCDSVQNPKHVRKFYVIFFPLYIMLIYNESRREPNLASLIKFPRVKGGTKGFSRALWSRCKPGAMSWLLRITDDHIPDGYLDLFKIRV